MACKIFDIVFACWMGHFDNSFSSGITLVPYLQEAESYSSGGMKVYTRK